MISNNTNESGPLIRTDFVAAASHELKTPVAGIELLADTLGMAISDGNTEKALEMVETLKETARSLNVLVTDLLELSRIEDSVHSPKITDVRGAVENSLVSHSISARERGISLSASLEGIGVDDVFVAITPTQFTIILDNLINNALAYTDAGSVTIELRCGITTVTLDVIDTGIGIPDDQLDQIFKRFYSIDEERSARCGGTGLGLALVKQAVEKAGGTISVSSMKGRGSTFSVTLPRAC
ncbi:MAG: HAMP domain-containing histidine kinase [Coriobacteriia bacterium]|nr:HAMP domain-containing histidine kinase [Coriobacteriia bacterium]